MTLFPEGYGDRYVTLDELRAKHQPHQHPEFARRLFAYLEHKAGALGIGNGFRTTQPVKPGAAPEGRSFHQLQQFASGLWAYAAVDLVAPDGPDGNHAHDTVTWAATADAPEWGLHTFIKTPIAEPWHIQCVEMRGWQTWVNTGRPDPAPGFPLPNEPEPPLPPPVLSEVDMIRITYAPNTPSWTAFVWTGTELAWVENGNAAAVLARANVPDVTVSAAELEGVIRASQTTTRCPHTIPQHQALWDSRKEK